MVVFHFSTCFIRSGIVSSLDELIVSWPVDDFLFPD